MTTSIVPIAPTVTIKNGKPVTTSQSVAKYFGKLHKNIIRSIKNLDCSSEFNRLNFEPVEYLDEKGQKRLSYEMTKDGFIFLVMGFTGKKAAAFKEAYIAEFNRMSETLNENPITKALALQKEQRLAQAKADAEKVLTNLYAPLVKHLTEHPLSQASQFRLSRMTRYDGYTVEKPITQI